MAAVRPPPTRRARAARRRRLQALRRPAGAAGGLLRGARRASCSRSSGPTARARPRCCRSWPARWPPRAATCRRPPGDRLGPAAAGPLLQALRRGEPAAVRAPRAGADVEATVDAHARADRPRRPRRRRGRPPLRRQPPARQHRRRPARRAARAPARRAVARRWTRASARSCGSSSARLAARGTTVVYSTHDVAEAEHYADRVLVLADGELLFEGSPRSSSGPASGRPGRDFEAAFVRFLHERGPLSRALAAAQGPPDPAPLAAAGGAAGPVPDRPRGADRPRALGRRRTSRRSPSSTSSRRARATFTIGGERLDAADYADELFKSVEPDPRQDARRGGRSKVRYGRGARRADPPARRHRAAAEHARPRRRRAPEVEVLYNAEDPSSAATSSRSSSRGWATPTRRPRASSRSSPPSTSGIIVTGGEFSILGQTVHVLGLERSDTILDAASRALPADSPRARRARAGRALRRAGLGQPRRLQADPQLDRRAR